MNVKVIAALACVALVAGCKSSKEQAATPAESTGTVSSGAGEQQGTLQHPMGAANQMCPMAVPGTRVQAMDTSSGAALDFQTSGEVQELQTRVQRLAEMYNAHAGMHHGAMGGTGAESDPHHGQMPPGGEAHGKGMGQAPCEMMMNNPPSRATVENTAQGARMVITPNDPSEVTAVRTNVQKHAMRMQQGSGCPMMQQQPSAPQQQMPTTP